MSFLGFETSIFGGSPVELYLFRLGNAAWAYTSGQTAQAHAGYDYQPLPFARSKIESGKEFGKAQLMLDAPADFPPARLFAAATPDGVMSLTVFRRHRGDSEVAIYWKGRVAAVNFKDGKATLTCAPMFTSLRQAGLRAYYQVPCRHMLYGRGCGLNQPDWRAVFTLSAVAGKTLTSPGLATPPSGWYNAGVMVFGDAQRMIESHAGDTVVLTAPVAGLAAGDSVELYPGCDHWLSTCNNKFGNAVNHGGFPWIPDRNPFTGDPIA